MKKGYIKGLSIVLSSAFLITSMAGCSMNTSLLKKDAKEEAVTEVLTQTVKPAKTASNDKEKFKEETVYVFTDANGSQKNIIVNEKLSNPDGLKDLNDETTLKELVNLSGDEEYKETSNGVSWNANGNAITYQGTSSKEAPVTIKATYYLDGKEISPKDLAGKSGKVKIRFDYTNNEKREVEVNGVKKEMYVPFTVVTGMLLNSDNFSNIEVTNGKVTEIGNDTLAIGIVLPGMHESLSDKLDELNVKMDIPESFEVTADVEDFKLDTVISVVTSNVSTDIDTDEIDTKGIEDKLDELKDATDQLSNGTDKLAEGTGKLADNVPDLVNGASDLEKGAKDLKDGAKKVKDGVGAYTDGVGKAADGAGKIGDGAKAINDATGELNKTMKTSVVPGLAKLSQGAKDLKAGINKLVTGMSESLDAGKKSAVDQANAGLAANADLTAAAGTTVTMDNIDAVIAGFEQKKEALNNELLKTDDEAAYMGVAAQIKAANPSIDAATLDAKVKEQILPQNDTAEEIERANQTRKTAAAGYRTNVLNGIAQLDNAITTLKSVKAQVNGAQGALDQVKASLTDESSAESLAALTKGASDLSDGLDGLKTGIGTYDENEINACIKSGKNTVCSALFQIEKGTDSLNTGAGDLAKGLATLKGKNKELNNGVSALADGAGKLADGSTKIKDATVTLNDGVGELNAGAVKLNDGMIRFNDEAISKVSTAFDDNSDNLIAEFKKLLDLGKEYKTFAGKSEDYDGNVIFIYKMDGIE